MSMCISVLTKSKMVLSDVSDLSFKQISNKFYAKKYLNDTTKQMEVCIHSLCWFVEENH